MNYLTLEDLAFIAYVSTHEDTFSDKTFLHLYLQKPRWGQIKHLICEYLYVEGEHGICYDCHDREDIYALFLEHIAIVLPNFARIFTYRQIIQVTKAYLRNKCNNASRSCNSCEYLLNEESTLF